MSSSRLLLATCASLWLALPALAVAQPGSNAAGQGQHDQQGRGDQHARGQAHRRPGQAGAQGQGGQPQGGGAGAGHGAQGQGSQAGAGSPAPRIYRGPQMHLPRGSTTGAAGQTDSAGRAPGASAGETPSLRRGGTHRPPVATVPPAATAAATPAIPPALRPHRPPPGAERGRPPLGDWNRALRGHDRDQAGNQWRRQHHDWDHDSPWKRDRNWWRHHRSFRFYFGPRIGFFFIPDYGYRLVPAPYREHYWRAGDYLPNWFWRYEVRNYWEYGLPEPPDGCAWVWVDNDVALIDLSDGYILDIMHNVW